MKDPASIFVPSHRFRLPTNGLWFLAIFHVMFALLYGVQSMADSVDYIAAAGHITAFIQSDHVVRTPGYPWFMALLGNYHPLIIFVQHGLVILLAYMFHATLEKDMPRLATVM